ncbi:monovalent cation/H(+) antiporter subunit G [Robertmurraya sp. Marseille-Q9965]
MSASIPNEVVPVLLILIGTIFSFLSAIGLVRLPDVYTRSHAASKSTTIGVLFILIGTFFFFLFEEHYFSIRLFLGIFFVFLTAPVASHVLIRSAYWSGAQLADESVQDDLKEVVGCEDKEEREPV